MRSEKWADRRRVSSVLSWDRILINLAAGGGQSWMSRAAVWIFTKGKNNSQHLVLVLVFACLTPHTYGEALITMTAFPYTCQHREHTASLISPLTTHHSHDLSSPLVICPSNNTIIKITIISHFGYNFCWISDKNSYKTEIFCYHTIILIHSTVCLSLDWYHTNLIH